ncbi:lysophospholipid acyltransferase family protein [Reinekea sp.]|jgi:1-acyl-sn-glycerol-3-phosphate acyltransferase|uniref:lysophospholipid acyltransferase family protein n=1 Tax=Reinekea sp. TaxID=1970455 RepID=UPI002A80B7FC|nr:lysophospholipid acyltransferase family protein [Reinekea sp.]
MVFIKVCRLIALAAALICAVFFVVVASLLDSLARRPLTLSWCAQRWYRLLLGILNVRVTLVGLAPQQGVLICSNHISWLDIPVIGSRLTTAFLAKAELRALPLLGWLAHRAGTLFIQRGGGQSDQINRSIQGYLTQNRCLTFFPEATTGNGYAIRQFHPRLFAAAIGTGTPVLPLALQYQTGAQGTLEIGFGDESLAENLWRILGRWRTDVSIQLLPVIQTEQLQRKALAAEAMHQIADVLNLPTERRGLNFRAPLPAALPVDPF